MRRYLSCFILWLMMLALLSRYALAATLQVAPVTLDLQSDQRAAAVYLTNSGKAAIHAQIRVYEWTQKNGKDVLVATGEVGQMPDGRDIFFAAIQTTRMPMIVTDPPASRA